jgi:hypothetical protein
MDDDTKALKNIQFSGKKEDFVMWQARLMSYANFKGFKDILQGTKKLITVKADETLTEAQIKSNTDFLQKNNQAYSVLHMCVRDSVSFGAIYNAMTEELPDGDAYKAIENLKTIYKPVSSAKTHELEQSFNQSSLTKETKNPDEWFAELEKIRLQLKLDFNTIIDDDKMISQIIYNIHPQQYKTTIALIKRDLNKDQKITLTDVKDDIRQQYGSMKNQNNNKKSETALVGKTRFKKQYKGLCRVCGLHHKADDCWHLDKNKSKRPPNFKPLPSNKNEAANATTAYKPYNGPPCEICQKTNHPTEKCWNKNNKEPSKKKSEKKQDKSSSTQEPDKDKRESMMIAATRQEVEMLMSSTYGPSSLTKNTFIADSGASCHMRNSTVGMYDLEEYVQEVTVGNSATILSKYRGKFKGTVIQQDGGYMDIVLNDVLFVPDLWLNLISLTKAVKHKHISMESSGELITLIFTNEECGTTETLVFDKIHPTGSGQLLGVEIRPCEEYANMVMLTQVLLIYEDFHEKLGHPNEQVVNNTASHYGFKIKEKEHKCRYCALGKLKKLPIPKSITNKSTTRGERINIDISSVAATSYGGAKYWLLIQDDYTDFLWSYFLKEKSQLPDTFMKWLNQIQKETKLTIKKVRCDNSGENRKLKNLIQLDHNLNVKFEFTAPNTPQQNGKIERKFATLYGKIRSMLNWARLTKHLRKKLWAQCASTATQLENIIVKDNTNATSYELFYGVNPEWIQFLRTFGEIAIVHDAQLGSIKGKLTNRGIPCLFIGYPEDHAPNVYQFLKLETETMILSRNATWMNQSYGEYKQLDVKCITVPEKEDDEDDIEIFNIFDIPDDNQEGQDDFAIIEPEIIDVEQQEQIDQDDDQDIVEIDNDNESSTDGESEDSRAPRGRVRGVYRELQNLEGFFNPDPYEFLERDVMNVVQGIRTDYVMVANIHDGDPDPKSYYEAKQAKDWNEWWKAMKTEFENMDEKKVWDVYKRTDLPSGRKLIGNRWVYVLKDDGRYRARTVAKGFSQVPGKDFQENFAPVINDTTFHLVLALKALMNLKAGQFDIETAFLYGDLEEEIWMQLPEGYSEYVYETKGVKIDSMTHCVRLKKALYGLVQAARQWWKKFKDVMKDLNYIPSQIDPCLFIKDKPNNKKAFVIIYVDDGGIFGTDDDIKNTISALSETFKVKDLGPLKHFVGCHIIQPPNEQNKIYIHQPKLIKHLNESFGPMVKHVNRVYKTPAGPKTVIMRPEPGDPLITSKEQTTYRSGVGMMLYLVKHSRPEISNAIRELSKVGDGATPSHWKSLMRSIKYVLDTQNQGLKIYPTQHQDTFTLEGIADSEYAGDRDTRISVYGFIIYFCGAPIAWKSKSGRSVTLSSTEAEYFAISEVAKELLFIKQIIESIGIKLELPIKIRTDNVGAIYLSNNYTTSQRTRHIDIRTHFVREHIEEGTFVVEFIRSEENDADIFTKNTTEEIFNKHASKNVEVLQLMNEQ